jgi:hypothetical protein
MKPRGLPTPKTGSTRDLFPKSAARDCLGQRHWYAREPAGFGLSPSRFDHYVPFVYIAWKESGDLPSQPRILEISGRPNANEELAAGFE